MKKNRIVVTGGNGQLGSELRSLAPLFSAYDFTFLDINEVDLTDNQSIREYFTGASFDFLINCAAYTAVDRAEEEPEKARQVNAVAPRILAEICLEKKIRFIHISTDYVFSGEFNQPIPEHAAPKPLSVYGQTKLEGEEYILNLLPDAYVIRTAWVYSTFGKNFVKTISNLASSRPELTVVADQIGSPTYAHDLAKAIMLVIESAASGKQDKPGIYHYTNEGAISWYDLAFYINDYLGYSCKVMPIKTSEYKTLAVRPKFSVLDKTKFKHTFGSTIPHWSESLKKCLDRLKADLRTGSVIT